MKYVIDIDGTICKEVGEVIGREPYLDRIAKINKLQYEGHTIVFQTARGMGRTSNNQMAAYVMFYNYTVEQLESWEVKYHTLYLGKPSGDIYVDDKEMRDIDFF